MASEDARLIAKNSSSAMSLTRFARPSSFLPQNYSNVEILSLEEKLYNARAACKIKVATVAMHLDADWRERFFYQLDSLMDIEEWDDRDSPVTDDSFGTLLRLLLFFKPKNRPGLGVNNDGKITAFWIVESDRLTITCFPSDIVRWVVSRDIDGNRETAAGQTSLVRLESVLSPYSPEKWFLKNGA